MNNEQMIALAKSGNKEIEEQVFIKNEGLTHHIANKYKSTGHEYGELFSLAQMGMLKAYNTFDANKGFKFATYATRVMHNEILMMLRKEKKRNSDMSIETPLNKDFEGNELTLYDIVEDESSNHIDDMVTSNSLKLVVDEFLKTLSERDKQLFEMHFYENQKQVAICESLSVSQSYVSRLLKKIIKELKKFANSKGFSELV